MNLIDCVKTKMQSKPAKISAVSSVLTCAFAFPSFATEGDLTTFTGTLTTLAAWLWKEVGLFCTFVLGQPMLMLALSIPFIGVIVNFFLRIFKSV